MEGEGGREGEGGERERPQREERMTRPDVYRFGETWWKTRRGGRRQGGGEGLDGERLREREGGEKVAVGLFGLKVYGRVRYSFASRRNSNLETCSVDSCLLNVLNRDLHLIHHSRNITIGRVQSFALCLLSSERFCLMEEVHYSSELSY